MSNGNGEDSNDALHDELALKLSLSVADQRKAIRKELTDPYNRLHSIAQDSEFVRKVGAEFPDFAVVANLRCGAWYVDPAITKPEFGTYFLSKDGHIGQWNFNLRRSNLNLLKVIQDHPGAIIVDSTRRGKRYPDSLSKAVPIWCSVVNQAIAIRNGSQAFSPDLFVPEQAVSPSERDQIRSRLKDWAESLAASSYALPESLKSIRPFHVDPGSEIADVKHKIRPNPDVIPLICLSASRYTAGGSAERLGSFNYVPGSGDDHEGWAPTGFTADLFWKHRKQILAASRQDLPSLLEGLDVTERQICSKPAVYTHNIGRTGIDLTFSTSILPDWEASVFAVSLVREIAESDPASHAMTSIVVPDGPKKHFNVFSTNIKQLEMDAYKALKEGRRVNILAEGQNGNAQDMAIGIVLVLLAKYYSDAQSFVMTASLQSTKKSILERLEWIIEAYPTHIQLSRGLLKRVYEYLIPHARSTG